MKRYLAAAGVVLSSVSLGFSLGVYFQKRKEDPKKVTTKVAPAKEFRHSDVKDPTLGTPKKPKKPSQTKDISATEGEPKEDLDYASVSRNNTRVDNPDVFMEVPEDEEEPEDPLGVRIEYLDRSEWEDHPKGYGVLRLTHFQPDGTISDVFGAKLHQPLHSQLIGDAVERYEIGQFDEEGAAFLRNNEVEKDIEILFTTDTYETYHS